MSQVNRWQEPAYLAFRVVVGFLFACHGAAKLFGVPAVMPGGTVEFASWPSWWAAVIELGGGVLVASGLWTRIAALISSGAMAYAYFVVHQPGGVLPIHNDGEPAALYSWLFLLIAVIGPGRLSLDRVLRRSGAKVPALG
ncbi:DoxX family protein [Pseudonocardia spinosispora]|uniref:DoxX family protein n=1 Tax=Pseudonocardia spinosispora TaxID=103441 RepID=UPI00041D352C|nr:DoxX family protein [Pseudonocardia spinosispora]